MENTGSKTNHHQLVSEQQQQNMQQPQRAEYPMSGMTETMVQQQQQLQHMLQSPPHLVRVLSTKSLPQPPHHAPNLLTETDFEIEKNFNGPPIDPLPRERRLPWQAPSFLEAAEAAGATTTQMGQTIQYPNIGSYSHYIPEVKGKVQVREPAPAPAPEAAPVAAPGTTTPIEGAAQQTQSRRFLCTDCDNKFIHNNNNNGLIRCRNLECGRTNLIELKSGGANKKQEYKKYKIKEILGKNKQIFKEKDKKSKKEYIKHKKKYILVKDYIKLMKK